MKVSEFLKSSSLQWSDINEVDPDNIACMSKKVYWWDAPCGHTFHMSAKNIFTGSGECPFCQGKRILHGFNDLLTTDPELSLEWSVKNDINPQQVTRGSKKIVRWICSKGHEWESTVKNRAVLGRGCPVCAGKKVIKGKNDLATTNPDLIAEFSPINEFSIYSVSKGSDKKVWWRCEKGHDWDCRISNKVSTQAKCPYCLGFKVLIGFNDLETLRKDTSKYWNHDDISPSDVTVGSSRKVKWKCQKDHTWTARVCDMTRIEPSCCPQCSRSEHSSLGEKELFSYIVSLLGENEVISNDRTVLNGKESDILIEKNKIIIEFNGIYWHSEKCGKYKNYHYDKWKTAKDKGYQMITVWEDDWNLKKEIVKAMLSHKLNKNNNSIGARSCYVSQITKEEAYAFTEENHIQGFTPGSYYLSLRKKNDHDVVSVMILKKQGEDLVLSRYSTKILVHGGQSKILSWIKNNYDFKNIITFSDNETSNGNMYEKTGWKKVVDIDPDYKYVYLSKRYHKFNFRKSRFESKGLFYDPNMTENELAKQNNLTRVWDCGKVKYIISFDDIS